MAKTGRAPRPVRITPLDHAIVLKVIEIDADEKYANVDVKLDDDIKGATAITKSEAATIGKFFTALSKAIPE